MLTLAAGDTLAGDADIAAALTVTVMGMELVGTTETYKILYQGQLPGAAAVLYTAPASTTAFIKSVSVVNTDVAATHQFQLFIAGTAAANAITPLVTVPKGGMATYEDGKGWSAKNESMQELTSIYSIIPVEGNYGVTGSKGETINRELCAETNTVVAGGTLFMQAIWLKAGTLVSNILLHSATTAGATLTNQFAGLYGLNRNQLAASANLGAAAWAAQTMKTFPMTVPYTVPTDGLYYIGFFVTATTVPTYKGNTAKTASQLSGQVPILQGTSNTALTTALPTPANAITASTASIWAAVT